MRVIALMILLAASGCQRSADRSAHEVFDMAPQDAETAEQFDIASPLTDGPSPETDGALSNAGHIDAGEIFPSWDPSLWTQRSCDGTDVVPPVSTEPFEMPERQPESKREMTADEFADDLPGYGVGVASVLPDAALEPGELFAYDLFSPGERDVTLHYYYWTARPPEELSSESMSVTVLVDYQPVEASWIRWNDSRTSPLLENNGTSIYFDVPRTIEIIEVTIPASAFPEQRAYDIALGMYSTSTVRSPQTIDWRMVLYNGGYQHAPRPCAPSPLGAEWEPIEEALVNAVAFHVLLFFEGAENFDQVVARQPVVVEGGSTIRFVGSFVRAFGGIERVSVAQPTVNGEPISDPFWVRQGGPETHHTGWMDARFSFEYTVPDEPGHYDVAVLTWEDAYETYRDLDGERIDNVSNGGARPREHSNPVRLVVEAD